MAVDFGPTAEDYVAYRRPFPTELLRRLRAFAIGLPDQLILDVGSGTGLLGRELARHRCRVLCADPSLDLLRHAPRPSIAAKAERLPLADESFDAVVAGQCWHWFDRQSAPREILRLLKPGGSLAILYSMPLSIAGNVVEATENLILRYRPRWPHANSVGISGQALRDLQSNRYRRIESFTFDAEESFTHDQWRGLIRTSSAIGASLPPDQIARFDRDHAEMLQAFPDLLAIPHRLFAAVGRKAEEKLTWGQDESRKPNLE